MQRGALAALLAVAMVAIADGGAGARLRGASAPSPSASAIDFAPCGRGFRCGTLTVPRVETDPSGATFDLAVIRRPASAPKRRIGVLVVNPGGPGAPAVDFLRSFADVLPRSVRERFDLVAYDPRGAGASAPIDCVDGLDDLFDLSFSPTDDEGRRQLLGEFGAIATACARRNPGVLGAISTRTAARDLDRLRVALGERRISYLGYSYGSYLGAVYAHEFPTRLRAIVLDGPIDPSADVTELTVAQSRGFEQGLDAFLASCSDDDACAFHAGGRAAHAYDELRAQIAAAPLAVGERELNDTRFDAAVLDGLYLGQGGWRTLASALAAAQKGNGRAMLELADSFTGREPDGGDSNLLESFWAIGCLDGPPLAGPDAMRALEAESVRVAPRVGSFVAWNGAACAVWPIATLPVDTDLRALGAPRALVVAARNDPATPFRWAQPLVRALGRGVVLSAPGYQHTSYLTAGSRCVDDAVTGYLLTRALPARGTRC